MAEQYSLDIVLHAQELYCERRLTYAQVADILQVTPTTLKNWAKKYGWKKLREELAHIESEIRVKTIHSRKKAIEMLLGSGDGKEFSQMAYAVSSLEKTALEQEKFRKENELRNKFELNQLQNSKDDLVPDLANAIQYKFAYLLQNPQEITGKAISDIKDMLEAFGKVKDGALETEAKDIKVSLNIT